MAKHEINFERDSDETLNEHEIINDIQKNQFFKWMEENGYKFNEIEEILDGKKLSAGEQSRFNLTLRKAKKEIKISLTEAIIFLEEFFVKFKKIITILDGETKFELKKELSENFKIKMDKNSLSQILG